MPLHSGLICSIRCQTGLPLSYNLGSEWDGFTPEPTFIYTLATGFSITESFGSYVELYGFAPQKQSARHSWDAGFTYLINNNVQLDIHAGTAITKMHRITLSVAAYHSGLKK